MSVTWDTDAALYRDEDGEPIAPEALEALAADDTGDTEREIEELTARLINGSIALAVWLALMLGIVRERIIRLYVLGRGGLEQMTDNDWIVVQNLTDAQYRYLQGFGAAIAEGGLSPAMIQARAGQYADAARPALGTARQVAVELAGYKQERWVRTASESCLDCIAFDGMGWQALGYFPIPGAGRTRCLTHCRCYKVYKK